MRVGKRRHIAAEPPDLLKTTVQDFEDLRQLPIALGVRPEMSLGEALAALEKRGAGLIAEIFWQGGAMRPQPMPRRAAALPGKGVLRGYLLTIRPPSKSDFLDIDI